jgi:hypothetical protein
VKHLRGPIHPHLLKLVPGRYESIANFAEELGLDELIRWGLSLEERHLQDQWLEVWSSMNHLEEGFSTIPRIDLSDAWGFGSQAQAFAEEQTRLREGYDYLERHGADAAINLFQDYSKLTHPDAGLKTGRFPHPETRLETWPVQANDDSQPVLGIVEAPAHIFARAWLELYDELQIGGVPKLCPTCNTPFIGSRKGQKYCSRRCQDQRTRSEAQRERERMYQRMRRGTITRREFAKWQQRTGRETRREQE